MKKSGALSTNAWLEGGPTRQSVDVPVMGADHRGWVVPVSS